MISSLHFSPLYVFLILRIIASIHQVQCCVFDRYTDRTFHLNMKWIRSRFIDIILFVFIFKTIIITTKFLFSWSLFDDPYNKLNDIILKFLCFAYNFFLRFFFLHNSFAHTNHDDFNLTSISKECVISESTKSAEMLFSWISSLFLDRSMNCLHSLFSFSL